MHMGKYDQGIFPKASIHENLPADFEVVWQQIAFSSDLAPIRAKLSLCTNGVGRDAVPSFEVRLRPDIII